MAQPNAEVQPTVRVMRLYKPSLHVNHIMPFLPQESSNPNFGDKSDFAISQVLLLIDAHIKIS